MTHDDARNRIFSRLPEILRRGGVMDDYIEAHRLEFVSLDDDRSSVIQAHQVENASGDDLDRLGAIFGELGERRGRDDTDYRVYLKGVIKSFNGRGSIRGLKFAVAAAVDTTTDNVIITEDFQNLEYDVSIVNVDTAILGSGINDLAELADPSAVKLDEAIIVLGGEEIQLSGQASQVTSSSSGLGSGILNMDGTATLG